MMDIENIWEEYRADILAFLHSRVANADDVDDLLQDILIKAYKKIHTVKSERSVKSWLFQIANHTIIDFYRKKNKSWALEIEDLGLSEDSFDTMEELSHCVKLLIDWLPKKTAELIIAIDIQGQSQKEYASNLDLNYSTVKSQVQKGRKQLRKQFEDCCYLSFDQYGSVIDFEPKSQDCPKC
ncbi:MAG: RNA polymerase sigma factor SigZ [Cyanobacteria bacterium P01_F01_bin.143]